MSACQSNYNSIGSVDDTVAMDELMSVSPVQGFLIKGPTVTFWRYRFPRYAHFVMIAVGKNFQGNSVKFGGTHDVNIADTTADLAYHTYLVANLPAIHAVHSRKRSISHYAYAPDKVAKEADRRAYRAIGQAYADPRDTDNLTDIGYSEMQLREYGAARRGWTDDATSTSASSSASSSSSSSSGEPFAYWTNAAGQALVKRAMLIVTQHTAQTLYSEYLYMWEELSGQAGKRLREMIGKKRSVAQLKKASTSDQRLYIPMPFYYTQTSGSALVLPNIKNQVTLRFNFEKLENLIVVSGKDVEVIRSSTNKPIKDDDLEAWVDQTYVWVSSAQRQKFAASNFDQLMTQVNMSVTPAVVNRSQVSIPLKFSHPIIELIFVARRQSHERGNQWFNFSGIDGRDPISTVSLRFDNKYRIQNKDAKYFRTVTCHQAHSNIPKGYIYVIPFAIDTESDNPNGATNPAIFNNADLILDLQRGLDTEPVTFIVFARVYNIMRFKKQLVGPLFN